MGKHAGWILVLLTISLRLDAGAQQLPTELSQVRFNSGQNVVPYFEGWIRNPDGTFDLVFGYFNRNWKEELAIAPGPDNNVAPAGPDSGQPTYFLPRRQRWVYRLRVPADFGSKEVTWTITAYGRTEKAYGNLLAAQEISERIVMSNGNLDPGQGDANEPPSIQVAAIRDAGTANPVTLTASIVDDGLPKPQPPRSARPAATGDFGAQVDRASGGTPRGLTISWLQYGGPAKVTFDRTGPIAVKDGKVAVSARFAMPGTYRLRATASDGALSTTTDVTITVR